MVRIILLNYFDGESNVKEIKYFRKRKEWKYEMKVKWYRRWNCKFWIDRFDENRRNVLLNTYEKMEVMQSCTIRYLQMRDWKCEIWNDFWKKMRRKLKWLITNIFGMKFWLVVNTKWKKYDKNEIMKENVDEKYEWNNDNEKKGKMKREILWSKRLWNGLETGSNENNWK